MKSRLLPPRSFVLTALAASTFLLCAGAAHSQIVMNESGFVATHLSDDFAKQIELGVGPDTCLYYGSFEGLKRRCAPSDPGTVCDASLTFPVGIAFSTGGSFGSFMYVADYGVGDIHRSSGCTPSTTFATIAAPGAIAFPPAASAYGDFLYACEAFDGPIYRVSSAGAVTTWLSVPVAYLRFGPGGTWGTQLYATEYSSPEDGSIVRISSTGTVTPIATGFTIPEGFVWGFDGDLFATDAAAGTVFRVKPNGTKTTFATLSGAADVAFRPGEQALYVVSNQGGLYRVVRGATTGVPEMPASGKSFTVVPNPARGACLLRFTIATGGLARVEVVDAAGRRVRRLGDVWRPAGAQAVAWDGRDESGAPVRAGTYFTRVAVAGETQTSRVTIVR